MKHLLEIAVKASLAAGKRIMEIYENEDFEVDFKGDNSPLTKADLASHKIIMSYLQDTGIPVLSEEGKDLCYEDRKNWKQLWIVDPIDGTKEFIKKNGEFTVNIALVENGIPIAGVVYAPALNDLYIASLEIGSYLINLNENMNTNVVSLMTMGNKLPIDRSDKTFTIVASRSHMSPETQQYVQEMELIYEKVNLISKGSSLKLCMVAEGKANCYPRFAPTMEWDTAAGNAIVIAANKKVTLVDKITPLSYNKENLLNPYFIVS